MKKLVIAEPLGFNPEALERLGRVFTLELGPYDRAGLQVALRDAEVAFARLGHRWDEALLRESSLRTLVSPTTGLDHIDLAACQRLGITVLSLRGEDAFLKTLHSTAELAWGLLLAVVRQIPAASNSVGTGQWDRDAFRGRTLCGLRLGILGYGRLGQRVAHYGRSFGMEVLACDRKTIEGVAQVDHDTLFATSDVVSVHVPASPENRCLVSQERLRSMPAGAVVINTSRGSVVDEPALVQCLREGRLGGVGLDVLWEEDEASPSSAELRALSRQRGGVVLTPHIGGACEDAMHATEAYMAQRLLEQL